MNLRSRGKTPKDLPARKSEQPEKDLSKKGEKDIHGGINAFLLKERKNSILHFVKNAAAVVIGGGGFIASGFLLLIACTAASCVFAGKDFTESNLGFYVFEHSKYLQDAWGAPVDLFNLIIDVFNSGPSYLFYSFLLTVALAAVFRFFLCWKQTPRITSERT